LPATRGGQHRDGINVASKPGSCMGNKADGIQFSIGGPPGLARFGVWPAAGK